MKKIVIITLFTLLSVFILCGAVNAATGLENSSWPKYQHDNNNTGQSSYKGPQTNHTKWVYNVTNDYSINHVSLGANNNLYFTDGENVYALYANKTLKWKYKNADVNTELTIGNNGIIYFGGWFGNLTALNPNGTLKWKYKTGTTTTYHSIYSPPSIGSDGTIYFANNVLYALNPNGTLKWKYSIPGNEYVTGYSMSSPAIGSDGTIYFGSNTAYLYALNRNGTLKWKYKAAQPIYSSPSIGPNGTIYFGCGEGGAYGEKSYAATTVNLGYMYALNPNGTLKWKYGTAGSIFSQTVSKTGTIYFYDYLGTYALNSNGTLKWKHSYALNYIIVGSDGILYAIGESGVYAIYSNGTIKWRYKTTNGYDYSPLILGSDGTLYFGVSGDLGDGTDYYSYLYAIQDKDTTAPKVNSTSPANNVTGVSRTSTITIKFSENIKTSTNWSKITVKNNSGTAVTITKSISGNTLYIKTNSTRSSYSYYTVYIPASAVKDSASNNLATGYTFKFKTGA